MSIRTMKDRGNLKILKCCGIMHKYLEHNDIAALNMHICPFENHYLKASVDVVWDVVYKLN